MTNSLLDASSSDSNLYVTMIIESQLFGVPVLSVRDVLSAMRITSIPLAPPEVAGVLNLRGRIVTAINLRVRLGLEPHPTSNSSGMSIVVENNNELYSLMVDEVGEVLSLKKEDYENSPATLDARWREVSAGIFRLDGKLMVVLDVEKIFSFAVNNVIAA